MVNVGEKEYACLLYLKDNQHCVICPDKWYASKNPTTEFLFKTNGNRNRTKYKLVLDVKILYAEYSMKVKHKTAAN